ncbi:hypothetical protein DK842_00505 [Chromobacterium phragmitis]|uniref:hypothetical protein n=1 Tax=Chromobacterium phragmitis TaxID=2202141 RepID=UPI000DECC769|nr:hypothetical protein [Chromobacterium phragmitis]AXE28537.1 hypothetical protein DK842_00505 [Chromobacterium phragmitis]
MRMRRWNTRERLLLALWLSLLVHAALLWLPLRPGAWSSWHEALRVRLRAEPEPAVAEPPPIAPPSAEAPKPASADEEPEDAGNDRLRLGADIYYPARELDQLAQERGHIALPDVALSGPTAPVVVLVFIGEGGRVDAVRFEGEVDARLADAIAPVFHAADYQPARKGGRAVKSYKRIRIDPQWDAATPPLSH